MQGGRRSFFATTERESRAVAPYHRRSRGCAGGRRQRSDGGGVVAEREAIGKGRWAPIRLRAAPSFGVAENVKFGATVAAAT